MHDRNDISVSIIIPVFNAGEFIRKCMDSVKNQTTTEGIECILIDDCGHDNSLEIIENYIEEYIGNVCFRLFTQNKNQGPSAARNRGIREAKGEYLFFLDADDTITSNCIEDLYSLAKKYEADYVQGVYSNRNVNVNENSIPHVLEDRKEIKRLLLNHNKIMFTPHNRLVKKQMIIDYGLFFNERIKVREDFLWMTFLAKYVEKFASTNKITYQWGYNEESLTHHIDIEREILGYRVLIETMVINYDPFLLGCQKELALEALLMALRAKYYHDEADRQQLIDIVISKNNIVENCLLRLYFITKNPKVLHFLIRLFKMND